MQLFLVTFLGCSLLSVADASCQPCYSGPLCSVYNDCSGRGQCQPETGKCECEGNYLPPLCVSTTRKNILFIAVDDLRPELNAFGPLPGAPGPKMHTPNIDKLASKSVLFRRAEVQQAVCSPSRTSFLTSRRPDTTNIWDLYTYFRDGPCKNCTTIPQFFLNQGYESVGMGKIFHPGHASGAVPGCSDCGDDQKYSWSKPYFHANNTIDEFSGGASWFAVPPEIEKEHPLPDNQTLDHALETMKQLKANSSQFFLGVGFHRPHLPFVFPEWFKTLYPDVKLPENPKPPTNMPEVAWSSYGEIRKYSDIAKLNATGAPGTDLPDNVVIELRRAYYSAVSYMDDLVGRLIDGLEDLGLADNTIISFIGDHGWQLGEHGEWCKHTNFELATHAPLMVHDPNYAGGVVSDDFVEMVDLMPTLVELAGYDIDTCPQDSAATDTCTEGTSLVPIFTGNPVKTASFSQYPRGYHAPPATPTAGTAEVTESDDVTVLSGESPSACLSKACTMGYSMLTYYDSVLYRYTEWVTFDGDHNRQPNFHEVAARELYNHHVDPAENDNVADNPSFAGIVDALSGRLIAGWRNATLH